jgi:hypothetical protein
MFALSKAAARNDIEQGDQFTEPSSFNNGSFTFANFARDFALS